MSNVDVSIWCAIVGTDIKIPPVNTYIYYFPQGHLEQSLSSSSYSNNNIYYNLNLPYPWITCQVLSNNFLANSFSDQPYVKMLLQPLHPLDPRLMVNGVDAVDEENNDVVSFVKILSPSDAKSSGGITIPKCCAENILPQLDHAINSPKQNLVFRDAHNIPWEFQHVYRGTPRRHLLTTGWRNFLEAKHLVGGDSIVFIKKILTNELFIRIRRAHNFVNDNRNQRCDRSEALAAITNSTRGMPFEVEYYPKINVPIFVVNMEMVNEALCKRWTTGMKVRMTVVTGGMSKLTWTHDTIETVIMPYRGIWCGSPRRTLQVHWDDPQIAQNLNRVSPWQVESTTPNPLDHDYHPSKWLTTLQDHPCTTGLSLAVNELPNPWSVSTLLCIGNSYPVVPSPDTQSSAQLNDIGDNSTYFQLFGKTIKMSRPRDSGESSHNRECTDGRKKCKHN